MPIRHITLGRIKFYSDRPKYNLPCMFAQHLRRNMSDYQSETNNEYTDKPQYPPILNLSKESRYIRDRDQKLEKLKKVGTVEEKQIGINMPRYYGWSSLILKEGNYPFNILPFIKHITRTDYIQTEQFPFLNNYSQLEIESIINSIRPQLQESIIMEASMKK